jgi:hypothetical protein
LNHRDTEDTEKLGKLDPARTVATSPFSVLSVSLWFRSWSYTKRNAAGLTGELWSVGDLLDALDGY